MGISKTNIVLRCAAFSASLLLISGFASAGDARYQVENCVKVYRFGPTASDIAQRNARAEQANKTARLEMQLKSQRAAQLRQDKLLAQAAYERGLNAGLEKAQTQSYRRGNRRYTTYAGYGYYRPYPYYGTYRPSYNHRPSHHHRPSRPVRPRGQSSQNTARGYTTGGHVSGAHSSGSHSSGSHASGRHSSGH